MLTSATRKCNGAFHPAELDLLGRVLKRLRSGELDEAGRGALARRVMANYMAGIADEDELVTVSKQPLGR